MEKGGRGKSVPVAGKAGPKSKIRKVMVKSKEDFIL